MMYRTLVIALAGFLMAFGAATGPVRAQGFAPAGNMDEIMTSGGKAVIAGRPFRLVLTVAGRSYALTDMQSAKFKERYGNLVLVALFSGGNGCPTLYAWLNTTAGQFGLSRNFGTCLPDYRLTYDANTVTLTMPSMDRRRGDVAFIYDGRTIREVQRKPALSDRLDPGKKPGQGEDKGPVRGASMPVDWLGFHPQEFLYSREGAGVIRKVVGSAMLTRLREVMQLSDGFVREGGWIVATAHNEYSGDRAGIALAGKHSIERVLVVYRPARGQARIWGDTGIGVPDRLIRLMSGR